MKAMLKKGGVFAALSAVLLLTAVLVTSCPDPYAKSSTPGYEPPAGYGYVQLNLAKNVGKTVLPSAPAITDFTWFELIFTPDGGSAMPSIWREHGDIGDPIPLYPDDYDLEVIAYNDASVDPTVTPPNDVWATFSTTGAPISITPGNGDDLAVLLTLIPPSTGSEDGTFAWAITDGTTDGFDIATMTVTTITGAAVAAFPSPVDLTSSGTPSSSRSLPEGYYFVDLDLALPAPGSETIKIRQVLQVYRYLTSTYTETFTDGWFGLEEEEPEDFEISSIDVEGIPNDPPVITGTGLVGNEATLNISGSPNPNNIVLTMTNAGSYTTYAWYCNSSTPLVTTANHTPNTFTPPFNAVGIYYVTVVGFDGAVPHATVLTIIVEP